MSLSAVMASARRFFRGGPAEAPTRRESRRIPVIPLDPGPSSPSGQYLAVVAIARNEGPYLAEWLEFHRLVGVEHVYLYDNASSDDTGAVVSPYVTSGFVTSVPWASFELNTHAQNQAYAHAICNFGPRVRWMAFIDVDEFLFPLAADDLRTALAAYDDLPALALHWHMFGPSGHRHRPAGLVIEAYLQRAPIPSSADVDGTLVKWKSIVDPSKVKATKTHFFTLRDGSIGAYDENRRWVTEGAGRRTAPTSSVFRLNHYFTKSEEEFSAKLAVREHRKDLSPDEQRQQRVERERLARIIEAETVRDDAILRFAGPLRERLRAAGSGCASRQ